MADSVKIKLCGLSRPSDIETANLLLPDYAGFVFAPKSRRYVDPEKAAFLRQMLDPCVQTVGVFVNEAPETIAALLNRQIIGIAQLHGQEDNAYIKALRALTDRPLIQAFRIDTARDAALAAQSPADCILLDAGNGGTGTSFDWSLVDGIGRPFFLAGGLGPDNVAKAIRRLQPFGVDVSSGIESDGRKDPAKMREFVKQVREYRKEAS